MLNRGLHPSNSRVQSGVHSTHFAPMSSDVNAHCMQKQLPNMQQPTNITHSRRAASSKHIVQAIGSNAPVPEAWKQFVKFDKTALTTSVTATSVETAVAEIEEAKKAGADIVELRLDFIPTIQENAQKEIPILLQACQLLDVPCIVTYRPTWEGGKYAGPEPVRLAALKYAAMLGAPFVDVEYKAADLFFAGAGDIADNTKIILSSHNYQSTATEEQLLILAQKMWDAGADIVKIAQTAQDVTDSLRMLTLLRKKTGPTISLAMGERGVITRILAPKYGGFLTFGALGAGRESAPGQPTLAQLRELYRLPEMTADTKVYGIVGSPVAQSKSPAIHNPSFKLRGYNGVYVPLLVDDFDKFFAAFKAFDQDIAGFSVTIPHKEAALRNAAKKDPVCASIGACNTLIRGADGEFSGYNTDWKAAIDAIENGLIKRTGKGLQGRTMVVLGAGGAGKALVYGGLDRGAKVMIANRTTARAEALAAEVKAALGKDVAVADWAALSRGDIKGDVLANTTSVGMHPKADESPVTKEAAGAFQLVFDAVYNPMETQLLKDAKAGGASTANGVEMFVGQAAEQFRFFTAGAEPPVDLMTSVVVSSLQK